MDNGELMGSCKGSSSGKCIGKGFSTGKAITIGKGLSVI